MKLLLTSGGLMNTSITTALQELVNRPFAQTKLAFIPTAANAEVGDKGWLIKDYEACRDLGVMEVDIVDISALPLDMWLPRLQAVDIIVVGGGNTVHLMNWVAQSGLQAELAGLLTTKVYVGISAGSMITAPSLLERQMQVIYDEKPVFTATKGALGLVDFLVVPHLNSPFFPKVTEKQLTKVAQDTELSLYALDDQSAVKVIDTQIEVISEGQWLKLN